MYRREVDELEARLWAELHGFNYFATSAASGSGVTEMFQAIIMIIIRKMIFIKIIIMINTLQAFFSHLVRLVESGLGTKTPRQGKKQVTCRHITIMVIVFYDDCDTHR